MDTKLQKIHHMEGFDYWKFSKDHNFKDEFLGKCVVLFCQPHSIILWGIRNYQTYKTTCSLSTTDISAQSINVSHTMTKKYKMSKNPILKACVRYFLSNLYFFIKW